MQIKRTRSDNKVRNHSQKHTFILNQHQFQYDPLQNTPLLS